LLGTPGNNPYCHYRALELQKKGLRERVVKIREAAKESFAVGEFDLITERISDGALVASTASSKRPVKVREHGIGTDLPLEGRVPPKLDLCRVCNCYLGSTEITCPHCGADVQAAAVAYEADRRRRGAIISEIERQLEKKLSVVSGQ
jgi:hypothetical protein